jgi:undecaprenyl diphosphate synthase
VTALDLSMVDMDRVPRHVGLILDGNGRWANARGLPRTAGHQAGEEALFDTIHGALELGIEWLTAYTFSTENWSRDEDEVAFLMFFNRDLLVRRRDELADLGVRIRFAGDLDDPRIPDENRRYMAESETRTVDNHRMTMVFAFNYGSRREIVEAARRIALEVEAGGLEANQVDEVVFARHLAVPEMPDVDLIIRSSGEHRLSNFLLWQAAYAELWFTDVLWPDFTPAHLHEALDAFAARERRYGGR